MQKRPDTNISDVERWASLLGGGTLLAWGIGKRSWSGLAMAACGGAFVLRGASGHCAVSRKLGINTAGRTHKGVPYELGIRIDKVITIDKSPAELYTFWRRLDNLPRIMRHLSSVTVKDEKRSHWVAKAPGGFKVEWDAEIVNDVANEVIGWRSLEGSEVDNGGSVQFRPADNGRGTEVRVELQYNPPAGTLGALVAKMFGEDPGRQIQDDLRRFKALMETGEVPATEGQPRGPAEKRKVAPMDRKLWDRDAVQKASEESFPASDAPSWTPEVLA